jgi:hypothetical protein
MHKSQYKDFFSSVTIDQSKPVEKLSAMECFKLKLWGNMNDEQWDSMKRGMKLFRQDILYSSKRIRDLVGVDEQNKIRDSLQMSELLGSPGSACVNLRKTLVWLTLMLNPGTVTAESIWKLMIDGRPKGLFID